MTKGKDIGTYHLRVEFENARGYIETWNTGMRFIGGGTDHVAPLSATPNCPPWKDEDDLMGAMLYMYTEGNYDCDCNRSLFIARAHQEEEPDPTVCGETIELKRLTLIRPDATEMTIWGDKTP